MVQGSGSGSTLGPSQPRGDSSLHIALRPWPSPAQRDGRTFQIRAPGWLQVGAWRDSDAWDAFYRMWWCWFLFSVLSNVWAVHTGAGLHTSLFRQSWKSADLHAVSPWWGRPSLCVPCSHSLPLPLRISPSSPLCPSVGCPLGLFSLKKAEGSTSWGSGALWPEKADTPPRLGPRLPWERPWVGVR